MSLPSADFLKSAAGMFNEGATEPLYLFINKVKKTAFGAHRLTKSPIKTKYVPKVHIDDIFD